MKKVWNGSIVPNVIPRMTMTETNIGGITRTVRGRIMDTLYANATVLGEVSHNPATDDKEENMTITVALAGPTNIRRITAFGDNISLLKNLKRGDVLDFAGEVITASANGGTPGFKVYSTGEVKASNTLPVEEPAEVESANS